MKTIKTSYQSSYNIGDNDEEGAFSKMATPGMSGFVRILYRVMCTSVCQKMRHNLLQHTFKDSIIAITCRSCLAVKKQSNKMDMTTRARSNGDGGIINF